MKESHRITLGVTLALLCAAGLALVLLLGWSLPPPAEPLLSKKQRVRMEKEFESVCPRGHYVVVDTASNKLYLRRNQRLLLEAKCSTGSGRRLEYRGKTWTFETPRGEFSVQGKVSNPIWRKPDWAFYEEGKPLPANEDERYERDVLGEYAMAFGNGYFVHGTLYHRMLGKNVTHGCIRLGSKDLMVVARTIPIGGKLYIY